MGIAAQLRGKTKAPSPLTAVSLFSGCGGFDLGAKAAGVRVVWANDSDSIAARTYRKLLPEVEFVLGDVRDVKLFPEADILIGCYPCTGFSGAARRRWRARKRNLKKDRRNYLYEEFLRALKQVRPRYLFVENVRGMVTAADGWFLRQQIEGFEAEDYIVRHALLDACDYGVPQNRKRVFIVGVRSDVPLTYKFPRPTHGPNSGQPAVTLRDAIADMPRWPEGDFFDYAYHGHYLTRNRKRSWDQASYAIVADAHHVPLHPLGDPMLYLRKDTWALQGDENRRLSWRECAVLQDLPKEIDPEGSLSSKYRVVGNAVPRKLGEILLAPVVHFEES